MNPSMNSPLLSAITRLNFAGLAALAPAQTLVLSVNNRHARRILAALSGRLDTHSPVMAVPRILPLSAWLHELADAYAFCAQSRLCAHVADGFGAQLIWRDVIDAFESANPFLNTAQAARLAAEADRLMDDWEICVQDDEYTPDHARFLEWREAYRARLGVLDVDDDSRTLGKLCEAIDAGELQLPLGNLVLAGFRELAPRVGRLLATLQDRGLALYALDASEGGTQAPICVRARDSAQEWGLAAQWAARQLQDHPAGRFAILVPDLESRLPYAHRILQRELAPLGLGFNVGLARSLTDWPVPRAALAWLRLLALMSRGQRVPAADAGLALLSGFCAGDPTDAPARAALDAGWRRDAVLSLTHQQFQEAVLQATPVLAHAWRAAQAIVGPAREQGLDGWVGDVRQALRALGFPGERTLDSATHQSLQAFDALLERLGGQAVLTGQVGFAPACHLLEQLARQTRFQPQRDADARLDVLGLLEAEGGRWDGVWIVGLTDEVLPAAASPNPLVPVSALRRAGAPRATPERELHWAQQLYQSLLACAPQVWLSTPALEGDRVLAPSPLLAGLDIETAEAVPTPIPRRAMISVADDAGPPLMPDEHIYGGIAVLDTQSRNPLWAFVRFRLGARAMTDYARQTDQSVRGLFLHRAMELLWQALGGQANLSAQCAAETVGVLVQDCVQRAATQWLHELHPRVQVLEMARAVRLIGDWLRIERARPPFEIVALERRERWSHAGLTLNLRLDRVDRLEDGRLAVLDYKTGAAAPQPWKAWARERLLELQLPLYAFLRAAGDEPVAALALVHLQDGAAAMAGLADDGQRMAGLDAPEARKEFEGADWTALLDRWRASITALAEEFVRGHAANRIEDMADMRYCDAWPFLRLDEEAADESGLAQ